MSDTYDFSNASLRLIETFDERWNPATVRDNIDIPQFEERGRVMDWRNHVPETWHEVWLEMPEEVRVALYLMAQKAAFNEEWE